ncbi:MAG: hypothetical protein HC802_21520, partial [Caldilineaceae bacterium]|nr:hypothetical protein [Caldilineaceae bacterium]
CKENPESRRAGENAPLLAWLEEEPTATARLRPWLVILCGLALLNALLFGLHWFGLAPAYWRYTLALYALLYLLASRGVGAVFHEAMKMRDTLQQLTAVFAHLEAFSYRGSPKLAELCAPFREPGHSPSAALGQVARVAAATGIQGNPLIAIAVNLVLPWNLFFAYRLTLAKQQIRGRLSIWLEAWTELELLSALANFSYLNPDYALPHVASSSERSGSVLDARRLGHPLLVPEERVCNDFVFSTMGEIGLITGSNMAGKSTFLKTVGINMALAYAGAHVAAVRLDVAPMRLFTSMRISDSLAEGYSYFYAEVQRLKRLLTDLDDADSSRKDEWPLLYLIDEIFRGTNNRERLIGSSAYVRSLAGKQGVGLISTHDLELARLADENEMITNYHFRDDITAGKMSFDYVIRRGPCPTTNALKIMALEGLPVDWSDGGSMVSQGSAG